MRWFGRAAEPPAPGPDAVLRERMLDAALEVLGTDPSAPLGTVARRARVDEEVARRLFPTRSALMEATVVRGAKRLAGAVFLDDGEPLTQIAMLVGRVWQDQAPVLPLARMAARGPYRRSVETSLAPLRATLREAVTAAAERHEIRMDLSTAVIAWLIEQAIIDVIEAAEAKAFDTVDGLHLAMTHALCAAGLGWREATAVALGARARLTGAATSVTPERPLTPEG